MGERWMGAGMIADSNNARWDALRGSYSAEWIGTVRGLDLIARNVALFAAESRAAGVTEDATIGTIAQEFGGITHSYRPHADAPNVGLQTVRTLRDAGLWPWQLVLRQPAPIKE